MNKGIELMIQSICRALGLNPQQITGQVAEIGKSLHIIATGTAQAARDAEIARRNSDAIMRHLGIASIEEPTDGKQSELGLGSPVGHG